MKILVLVRPGQDGEFSPFEKSAYEMALRVPDAEVALLSMAPPSAQDALLLASRLGAKEAILLSDPLFAGSDTLVTAETLSLAVKKLAPDVVLCGRKTLTGDTAQVPPMLAQFCDFSFEAGVLGLEKEGEDLFAVTYSGRKKVARPAVLAAEKSLDLRRPRLGSRVADFRVLDAAAIGAAPERCGLAASPTRVLSSRENTAGRRKCRFFPKEEFFSVLEKARIESQKALAVKTTVNASLSLAGVWCVGEKPLSFAESVCEAPGVLPEEISPEEICLFLEKEKPAALLFPSTPQGRECACRVAVKKRLGVCADCTALESDGEELFMIRPALSGSVLARIKSRTRPALCTVRTESETKEDFLLGIGMGAKDEIPFLLEFAEKHGALPCASRRTVDAGLFPYPMQVGLTGKTVAPALYLAVGISGAVHHLAGMDRSRTVIAVNPDRNAPIFDFADYGFVMTAEDLKSLTD